MEIDTSNLTDEQITKLGEFIHSMENENKKVQKWWVVPKYSCFSKEVQEFGQSYVVEPQKDFYSRSAPPLKSDFGSKGAAERWLKEYLKEKEEKDRFITNKELVMWLSKGNGQFMNRTGLVFSDYVYNDNDDAQVNYMNYRVRKWGDTEWNEPTYSYCFGDK